MSNFEKSANQNEQFLANIQSSTLEELAARFEGAEAEVAETEKGSGESDVPPPSLEHIEREIERDSQWRLEKEQLEREESSTLSKLTPEQLSAYWEVRYARAFAPYLSEKEFNQFVKGHIPPIAPKSPCFGTRPYITDQEVDAYLKGIYPTEATETAVGDLSFFIWTRGIATYKAVRHRLAEEGYFVEEIDGNACIPRPFPIDLHSEEGLAAFAAGKPLPHPVHLRKEQQKKVAVKVKRSWWRRLFLCGTVAL